MTDAIDRLDQLDQIAIEAARAEALKKRARYMAGDLDAFRGCEAAPAPEEDDLPDDADEAEDEADDLEDELEEEALLDDPLLADPYTLREEALLQGITPDQLGL